MSNIIGINSNSPVNEQLSVSNGTMDVLINVLLLSGSEIAVSDNEKMLIVWLAEKDQHNIGRGGADFDIAQMPFTVSGFSQEKSFLIKVTENALNKIGWSKLDYNPNEEIIMPLLEIFRKLIEKLTVNDILENERQKWLDCAEINDPVKCGFPKCRKHGTLLSLYGCQICNN